MSHQQYLTTVRISNNTKAMEFVYESVNDKEMDLTFIELVYHFNGLGYVGTDVKDGNGNVLAHLICQRAVHIHPEPKPGWWRKTKTRVGGWFKRLKWW